MAGNWRAIGVLTAVTVLGLGVGLPLGAVEAGPAAASAGEPALRDLNGLEPHRDPVGTKVIIQRGSATDASGQYLITISSSVTVDITVNGINGLDTGTPVDGQWYYLYLMYDAVAPQLASGAVFSRSTTYGGVAYPPGYTHARKLPFAVYRQDDPTVPPGPDDGKFRPYRIFNWPAPYVDWTPVQTTLSERVVTCGRAVSWTTINLFRWMPLGAQMAALRTDAKYESGTGDRALLVQPGSGSGNAAILVARVSSTLPSSIESYLPLQTNSVREINYKWDSVGGCVDIYVKGFYWNDPV